MADSALHQQLHETCVLLARARELFGANPIDPPTDVVPMPGAVSGWLR
ncbi:hypothetical protein [Mycobacterium shimoidei]|nr:hypothetical protein [Mycobacterium shimoidei]MCV7258855.1 hypothetical protein [Mycobacterium shimoidei]